MKTPPVTVQGLGFAFMAFALFATHDAVIKTLGNTYSVFQIIFFATLFSFIPMSVSMLTDRRIDNFRPHHPWLILLRGVLQICAMSGAFYAFATLPLAEVYALLFAVPLLVTILSVPLLGEVVRRQRWAAVFVGLIGVIVVLRPGVTEFTLGHAAAVVAAVASAFASILVRRLGGEERSAVLILYPMLVSILAMTAVLPSVYQPMGLGHLAMMAIVGVLSVFAQHMLIAGYRSAPAAVVAPMQYSQIIWAAIFGAFFFNEQPDMWVAIGAGIIIASGVFVVWRESTENVSDKTPVLRTANPRADAGPSPKPKSPYREKAAEPDNPAPSEL